jgi:spore germination protein YaaH
MGRYAIIIAILNIMNISTKTIAASFLAVAIAVSFVPTPAAAETAAGLEVTGWIPYWTPSAGPSDARRNIDQLDEIHPFAFSVESDGDLKDLAKLSKSAWKRLFSTARKEDVRIVPTVMWSDGAAIHAVLSDSESREDHIDEIVKMVKKGKYDGVDIDYEAKLAETKDYFSTFLEELKDELGDDLMLTCAIEARTPPDSLYRTIPANIQYANDYARIGAACDRVQIMGYDQGRADYKLNDAKSGMPYSPNADVDWVRKVVQLTLQTIPADKLVLGVPTYGREYEVSVMPNWFNSYRQIRSVNPEDALDTADDEDVKPSRTKAGEIAFTYAPDSATKKLLKSYRAPAGTPSGMEWAARALAYANATGNTTYIRFVNWSDAEAIGQKVDLAEEFGLRGIAVFKFDGEEDEDIWEELE